MAEHVSYEVTAIMIEVVLERIGVPPRPELIRERLLEIDRLNENNCTAELIAAESDPALRVMATMVGMLGRLILDHSTPQREIATVPSWVLQTMLDTAQHMPNISATMDRLVTDDTSQKLNGFLMNLKRRMDARA